MAQRKPTATVRPSTSKVIPRTQPDREEMAVSSSSEDESLEDDSSSDMGSDNETAFTTNESSTSRPRQIDAKSGERSIPEC